MMMFGNAKMLWAAAAAPDSLPVSVWTVIIGALASVLVAIIGGHFLRSKTITDAAESAVKAVSTSLDVTVATMQRQFEVAEMNARVARDLSLMQASQIAELEIQHRTCQGQLEITRRELGELTRTVERHHNQGDGR